MQPEPRTPALRRWLALLLPWTVLLPLVVAGRVLRAAPDDTFVVNSLADVNDAAVGDGVCETGPGNGLCTLRAAIQEANAFANPDTIMLAAGTYSITRSGVDDAGINGDFDLTGTVTLRGAGPASTIIDAGTIDDRVLHVFTGTVTVTGVTLRNGRVVGVGGGVFVRIGARLTLSDTTITGNTALGNPAGPNPAVGGGIYNVGHLTVHYSTISSNTADVISAQPAGAGLYNLGNLTVTHSLITGNVSAGTAGGLFTQGPAAVVDSTLSGNRAQNGGGAFINGQSLRLINSTLSGNQAERAGGGVYAAFGTLSLNNVTLTDNSANAEVDGAYTGGGILQAVPATVTFVNSLLAGNTRIAWGDPLPLIEINDCSGNLTSLGANYVGVTDPPCTITGTVPATGGSARLAPLAYNGGPTPTHALRAGSPAIDAGEAGGCADDLGAPLAYDQRGARRPQFGQHSLRCDLGAFEYLRPLWVPLVLR